MSPIALIVAALGLANPQLPTSAKTSLAHTIQVEATRAHVDPLLIASIIWNESGFRSGAVSADGEDYGLGQIRARYIGACRKDSDPVHNPSQACLAVKSRLLEPTYNIKMTVQVYSNWRKACREATGTKVLTEQVLAGYAGESRPPVVMCGMRKVGGRWQPLHPSAKVNRILNRYRQLRSHQLRPTSSASASPSRGNKSSKRSRRGR